MESFPNNNEQKPSFKDRLDLFVQKGRDELGKEITEDNKEKISDILDKVNYLEQNLLEALNPEIVEFLETEVSEKDFDMMMTLLFSKYISGKVESLDDFKKVSVNNLKNNILHRSVYGYGHPDVEKRKSENPVPTAQELLLGCYIEQIESQTRQSVLTLREKGYRTVESGFHDKDNGSQFFHLDNESQAVVSEELATDIKEKFDVAVSIEPKGNIEFTPSGYKTLEEWNECLNYFADRMPVVGEEAFATYGGAIDFAFKSMQQYPLEEVIQTARNEKEKELIAKLYDCKTKKEVAALMKGQAL